MYFCIGVVLGELYVAYNPRDVHSVINFEPCHGSVHTGPDGTEIILEEGGVHSLNFAIACDNGSNIMSGPLQLNTKEPKACEPARISRIQRESQAMCGFSVTGSSRCG